MTPKRYKCGTAVGNGLRERELLDDDLIDSVDVLCAVAGQPGVEMDGRLRSAIDDLRKARDAARDPISDDSPEAAAQRIVQLIRHHEDATETREEWNLMARDFIASGLHSAANAPAKSRTVVARLDATSRGQLRDIQVTGNALLRTVAELRDAAQEQQDDS